MALRQGEILIDHSTPIDVLFMPRVDGEMRARGLVPRNYLTDPEEMFSAPSEIPLIPKSEWSDRIKEMEATESLLSHVRLRGNGGRPIPSLDQGQVGYCHTGDTEVLTEAGWVAWADYNYTDRLATANPLTGRMEFQAPFEKHVYDYDGEMIYGTGRRVNFAVTADHRMLVCPWREKERLAYDRYDFVRAGDLPGYCGLPATTTGFVGTEVRRLSVPGDREYDGDDFFALLGLIVSDGWAGGTANTKNWVSFASFRDSERPAIAALASRTGFHECPGRPGVWIRYNAGALANWLRSHCYAGGQTGAQAKRIPDIVKWSCERQIKLFMKWFDDRDRAGRVFYTSSRHLADGIQELSLKVGRRASVGESGPKDCRIGDKEFRSKGGYGIVLSGPDRSLCIERKNVIERDRYKGPVYCAAVPNGTLITRRDGTVLVSGNCWAHSTTHTVMMDRAKSNQPYVPLSAYAVAATIKKGKDEGGWCGLSAKFWREKGGPSQSLWPQGDRDYRKYDKPEIWANAQLHMVAEDFVDLTRSVYDQNLTFEQVICCLLARIPLAVDFNWWGHSVCALDPVEVEPGSFGIRILNSWSDKWGDQGMSVLRGEKAVPNSCVATRVSGAAVA